MDELKKKNLAQYHDLTLIDTGLNQTMVIAVDNSAGIGEKPGDTLHTPTEITAKFTIRVCLVELLAMQARPQNVFTLIGNEKEPTGRIMWQAIKEELTKLPYSTDITLNGSTEDNMKTSETNIGVVTIGVIDGKFLRPNYGDVKAIVQVGEPLVGQGVLDNLDVIPTYQDIYDWSKKEEVIEIVPVGSRGSQADLNDLFSNHQLPLKRKESPWLSLSGGPSTSFVIMLNTKDIPDYLTKAYKVELLAVAYD